MIEEISPQWQSGRSVGFVISSLGQHNILYHDDMSSMAINHNTNQFKSHKIPETFFRDTVEKILWKHWDKQKFNRRHKIWWMGTSDFYGVCSLKKSLMRETPWSFHVAWVYTQLVNRKIPYCILSFWEKEQCKKCVWIFFLMALLLALDGQHTYTGNMLG